MEEAWTVYTGVEEFHNRADVRRIRVALHVTAVPGGAFRGCRGLREVDLSNVTEIGAGAFYECSELKSVDIPSTVTEIENLAFAHCTELGSVTLCDGLKVIRRAAFAGCEKLESVAVPSTVTEIGGHVFSCCSKLGAATLCEGLRVIGQYAFKACVKLESVAIPSTVTEIGESTFFGCTKLKAVEFLGGIQTFGNRVFEHCTSLERIVIPSPAFVISEEGSGNTLRCQLSRDAAISPDLARMVVSKHVKYMSPDRLEEAGREINEILGRHEQWQAQIRKLFAYYELLDATTLLELAIWKAKIGNARGKAKESSQKRARVDSSSHRHQCRTDSGAHIILPLVVSYLGGIDA